MVKGEEKKKEKKRKRKKNRASIGNPRCEGADANEVGTDIRNQKDLKEAYNESTRLKGSLQDPPEGGGEYAWCDGAGGDIGEAYTDGGLQRGHLHLEGQRLQLQVSYVHQGHILTQQRRQISFYVTALFLTWTQQTLLFNRQVYALQSRAKFGLAPTPCQKILEPNSAPAQLVM